MCAQKFVYHPAKLIISDQEVRSSAVPKLQLGKKSVARLLPASFIATKK